MKRAWMAVSILVLAVWVRGLQEGGTAKHHREKGRRCRIW